MAREGTASGPDDGTAPGRRIDGSIGELLVASIPGRTSSEEVIVVNPFGLGIEDVGLAWAVFEVAVREGLGVHLPR